MMSIITNETRGKHSKNQYAITATRARRLLRASKHQLHASKSNGLFICRIVDKEGRLVGTSSRPTLESAVTVAISHILL